jgi:single-stranded DNA-binding protein
LKFYIVFYRTKVYVEGKLQYREYEKDGVKRTSTEILVSNEGCLVVLSPKESSSGGGDSANAANVNSVGRTSATPTGGSSGRR